MGDRAAISAVLFDYCRLLDDQRIDEMVAAVYLPDAIDHRRADRVLRGHEEIRAMFASALTIVEATMHQLTNVEIDVSGDAATAFSYVQANHWMYSTAALGPVRPVDVALAGTYSDNLVRTDAGWRIAIRRVGYRGPAGLLAGEMPDAFSGFAGGPH